MMKNKLILMLGIVLLVLVSSVSANHEIIIYATTLNTADFSVNDCTAENLNTGVWNLSCTGADYETQRAQLMKTLFYGTDGSDPKVILITNPTALITIDNKDVGKKGFYAVVDNYESGAATWAYTDITFSDTTANTDCSSWSYCINVYDSAYWQLPKGTTLNLAAQGETSDETGTDTSADETDNPANATLYTYCNQAHSITRAYGLYYGGISFADYDNTVGEASFSHTDFYTDYSIPAFTLKTLITANTTTPDPAIPTQDWQVNITATNDNNATFYAWTQFYINSTVSGAELPFTISNDTNTNIANLSNALFGNGATLTAEIWVGDGTANTTKINITDIADIIDPDISMDDLGLNLTYVYVDDNLTGQINASDPNLYSINISIDDVSIFNTTGLSQTDYVYNLSQNMSSYGSGVHNISVRVCDGHTDTLLKEVWDYDISLGSLTFKDSKDNKKWYRINPTNNDLFESISTTKLTDRYTFEYSKSVIGKVLTGDIYTFIVESSEYIDIIDKQQSKYNAWMVIPSMERWIDFNLKGVPDAKYVVTRLNDKQVRVEISNVPKDLKELVFESTGELNCITEYYEFYVFDYTATHDLTVLETSSQTFYLNITRDSDFITNANATLNYNGTDYIGTKTTTDNYFLFSKTLIMPSIANNTNATFNWSYTLIGNENITNVTDTYTQTIYNIDFDDCSTYTIQALNFSLIEESNNASIAGDMDFTFSLVQEGITINYSKSVTGVNSTAFCIPSNDVSFTAQLQSEYTSGDYESFTYFAYNLAVTNTTQYITYYLTNGTTIVEFTVVDQSGNDIEDAYIKVMKYDIGTGVYKTIEVLKTDELGKALGNIVLDTEWYKFMVEYNGVTYLDTSATKMTSTTRTFTINLLSDFFDRYTDVVYNIYSTLNYTEATGNFAFTYSDPNGNYHQGCLRVERMAAYGNTLINETCVSSTAATILVNVNNSGPVNGTYVAVGYILFDDKYVLQTLTETWGHLSDKFGIEGLFYAFFIIITVVMVGIFNPKLAIILGMLGLIVSNILGFMFIELGWLVGIIFAAALTIYRMRDN